MPKLCHFPYSMPTCILFIVVVYTSLTTGSIICQYIIILV